VDAPVKVRIAIEQKDPRILPDMGVRVSFLEETTKNADTTGGGGQSRPKGVLHDRGAYTARRPQRQCAHRHQEKMTTTLIDNPIVSEANA